MVFKTYVKNVPVRGMYMQLIFVFAKTMKTTILNNNEILVEMICTIASTISLGYWEIKIN